MLEDVWLFNLCVVRGNLPHKSEQPVEEFCCIVATIGEAILFAQQLEEWLPAQHLFVGIAEALSVGIVALYLKLQQRRDDAVYRCVGNREAHRDVHLLCLLWNGMKHGLHQGFVAKNDSPLPAPPLGECPRVYISRCCVVRGTGNEGHVLEVAKVVEGFSIAYGIGEVEKVLLHKEASLELFLLRVAIVDVVVPIEACLAFALDEAHHVVLHVIQYVEACKDDGSLAFKKLLYEAVVCLHLFRDVTQERTFPKLAFCEKPFVQLRVDFVHVAPCVQELLLKACAVLQGEASEEAFQCLSLVVIEVVEVLELFLVGNVREDGFRVGKMLVDVIEVCHKHFAPAPEIVERFGIFCAQHFLHDAVQLADALQGVGQLDRSERKEEVAHRAVAWRPHRLVAQQGKLPAQEHAGTLAGEDYRHIAHVIREVRQHVGCYEREKG